MKGALAALALGAALALSPATATPALAQEIPIHYLEDGGVPVSYRYFTLDTSSYPAEKVRFNGKWRDTGWLVYPLSMSSSVTFPEVGIWTAPDGREHPIDMTLGIVDWNGFCIERNGGGSMWIYNLCPSNESQIPTEAISVLGHLSTDAQGNCLSILNATFTFSDGTPVPESFSGVTGFNDIDGWSANPTIRFEHVGLDDGFDGAYLLRDHHLSLSGNGDFFGISENAGDEKRLDSGLQPLHRLATTWKGGCFTFSFGGNQNSPFHTVFGAPIDTANLKWSLRAVCVDDDGKVLRTVEDGRTIRMGSTWDFTPQDIEGYTYMGLAEGSAPLKGTITSANMTDQTVTMRYAKRHTVKAVCIDEDGNTLKEPWVIGDGLLRGDEWDVTPPRIADYAFKAVAPDSAPIRGTVDASTPASQTITLVYEIDDSNLTVTVPTVIPFTMGADGHLTSASSGALQIVNGSNFAIHVSGVSVAKQSPFNIVADAAQAAEDNAVDFQFGVDSALIDAANPTAKAGSYDLAPTGDAGATLTLKAQGDAKNVKRDLSVETKLADITWTFTVGEAG